jgi:hypothetical protein
VNPRPEIVLPPGFALRIDYDPESSPASLLITAYRDDAPVGQAHVDPREVGQRLRLEIETGGDGPEAERPRLRLTPQRGMRAIVMDVVHGPPPVTDEQAHHPAMAAVHELAREGSLGDECHYDTDNPRAMNALVWLQGGSAVVLPDAVVEGHTRSPWMQRALRAFSLAAVDLLGMPLRNPLRLRDVDGLAES